MNRIIRKFAYNTADVACAQYLLIYLERDWCDTITLSMAPGKTGLSVRNGYQTQYKSFSYENNQWLIWKPSNSLFKSAFSFKFESEIWCTIGLVLCCPASYSGYIKIFIEYYGIIYGRAKYGARSNVSRKLNSILFDVLVKVLLGTKLTNYHHS